jgi:hypothetical protein
MAPRFCITYSCWVASVGAVVVDCTSAEIRLTCWVNVGISCAQVVGGEEEEEDEEGWDSSLSEKKGGGG